MAAFPPMQKSQFSYVALMYKCTRAQQNFHLLHRLTDDIDGLGFLFCVFKYS